MAELQPTRESKHSSQWTTCAPCDSVFLRVAMYALAAPLSSLSESLNHNVWRSHPLEPASRWAQLCRLAWAAKPRLLANNGEASPLPELPVSDVELVQSGRSCGLHSSSRAHHPCSGQPAAAAAEALIWAEGHLCRDRAARGRSLGIRPGRKEVCPLVCCPCHCSCHCGDCFVWLPASTCVSYAHVHQITDGAEAP